MSEANAEGSKMVMWCLWYRDENGQMDV